MAQLGTVLKVSQGWNRGFVRVAVLVWAQGQLPSSLSRRIHLLAAVGLTSSFSIQLLARNHTRQLPTVLCHSDPYRPFIMWTFAFFQTSQSTSVWLPLLQPAGENALRPPREISLLPYSGTESWEWYLIRSTGSTHMQRERITHVWRSLGVILGFCLPRFVSFHFPGLQLY